MAPRGRGAVTPGARNGIHLFQEQQEGLRGRRPATGRFSALSGTNSQYRKRGESARKRIGRLGVAPCPPGGVARAHRGSGCHGLPRRIHRARPRSALPAGVSSEINPGCSKLDRGLVDHRDERRTLAQLAVRGSGTRETGRSSGGSNHARCIRFPEKPGLPPITLNDSLQTQRGAQDFARAHDPHPPGRESTEPRGGEGCRTRPAVRC